jgi:hypothetical protein
VATGEILSFEELADARRLLKVFCLRHVPSLLARRSGISFKLFPDEKSLKRSRRVRHLTTTATCLSSLLDCPEGSRPSDFADEDSVFKAFAKKALSRRKWKSEGSAEIYCRCRALPLVIKLLKKFDQPFDYIVGQHLARVLSQLEKQPGRFGVGEADPKLRKKEDWASPNAFHTYWTLEALSQFEKSFPKEYASLSKKHGIDAKREGMLLWAQQRLGYEISLHSEPKSSVLDTDQLGWALATFLSFEKEFNANLAKQDLIKQAFKCLFSTQNDVGTWSHYKPLFHYRDAGNAYCYVFETFAVLLQCALQDPVNRPESEVVQTLLKPYCGRLMDLWRYAVSTQIPLSSDEKVVGWSSGHRISNPETAESWATASVFSYAQSLRRLIGIWCRDEALKALSKPQKQRTQKEAIEELTDRGRTWHGKHFSVSEQLWTLFINPVRMHHCLDRLEPDSQPIDERQARSAILFGPPGTSKTSLVRALANIIDWNYVEIHASHFVADGLTQVQKTADRIFKQLSELDHVVVLFDEIDELVRERNIEKDAFGRFLTTSMLPKLAELWDARKILYFVATNHINYFDSAIVRSHRFDALILVSPPSFKTKIKRLTDLLFDVYRIPKVRFQIKEREIQKHLESFKDDKTQHAVDDMQDALRAHWRELELQSNQVLAKFALLRFDELEELANRLAEILKGSSRRRYVSNDNLKAALLKVDDSQWRKNESYSDYLRDVQSERRDYQMLNVWECINKTTKATPGLISSNERLWLARPMESLKEIDIRGYELQSRPLGRVRLRVTSSK